MIYHSFNYVLCGGDRTHAEGAQPQGSSVMQDLKAKLKARYARMRRRWRQQTTSTNEVASTIAERVDVSVLMQYYAASTMRRISFAESTAEFLQSLVGMLRESTRLSFEVLVNSDSRHVRHGDARTLLPTLAACSGFLLLSPNLGEAHALNTLAKIARGEHLLLVQEDWTVSYDVRDGIGWLVDAFRLFRPSLGVGMVGFDVGVRTNTCIRPLNRSLFARCLEEGDSIIPLSIRHRPDGSRYGCQPTEQDEHSGGGATIGAADKVGVACQRRRWGRVQVLGAYRCVSMGPLLIRRALFESLGGFDERIFERGKASSLLDCELSARVWQRGLAVVLAAKNGEDGKPQKPFIQRHGIASVAWTNLQTESAQRDYERCVHVEALYAAMPSGALERAIRSWDGAERWRCAGGRSGTVPERNGGGRRARQGASAASVAATAAATTAVTALADGMAGVVGTPSTTDLASALNLSFAIQYWGGAHAAMRA